MLHWLRVKGGSCSLLLVLPQAGGVPVGAVVWEGLGNICIVLFNPKPSGVADVAAPAWAASLPSPLWLLRSNIGGE